MATSARTTSVQILGRHYKIRTTETEEFVREVASFVDEQMQCIYEKTSSGTHTQVAVLAALNIAEQLFRERRNGDGGADATEVDSRLRALSGRLDEILELAAPDRKAKKPRKSGAKR